MKSLTKFILIGSLFIGCTKDKLTASGDQITEARFPGEFTGVDISGSNTVHIMYGTTFKVELKGSNNLVPYFKTNVINNTLYLGYENASVFRDDIEVHITLPAIRKVSARGSGKINITGTFQAVNEFKLSLSGSAETTVHHTFESDELLVYISGSGKASLEKISCNKAEVNLSGNGDARIKVQDKLKARISGSGHIYYIGNPEIDADISGSGRIVEF